MSLCILLPQTKTQEIKSRERQYSGKGKKKKKKQPLQPQLGQKWGQ